MKKVVMTVLSLFALLFLSIVTTAIQTHVELPETVWKGGTWVRFQPSEDMQTRLIHRFGGKTSLEVIKELYEKRPEIMPLSAQHKEVKVTVYLLSTHASRTNYLTTGQDDCRTQGLTYCDGFTNTAFKQKCAKNVWSRCARLQAQYS